MLTVTLKVNKGVKMDSNHQPQIHSLSCYHYTINTAEIERFERSLSWFVAKWFIQLTYISISYRRRESNSQDSVSKTDTFTNFVTSINNDWVLKVGVYWRLVLGGAEGFEPPTFTANPWCANQTTLRSTNTVNPLLADYISFRNFTTQSLVG